jgi:glycosyltransferase involved in cell wall biosynthesis
LQSICGAEKNITILGFVPNVRLYYWNSGIFILPMQSGSGIKNKALEAWASGCALISTSLGMEGIKQAKSGENVLIADEPDEFINLLIWLINHPQEQRKLGIAGRKTVSEYFSWDATGLELCNLISQTIRETRKL